jgi:hydrogenase maturation protease
MRIRIIGLGNVLMSDDGFGPHVVKTIDALFEIPPHVQLVDGGTPGVDLTSCLIDADVAIFVDTVSAGGRAGQLQQFRLPDMLTREMAPALGAHDPALKEALLAVAAAGLGPTHVLVVGVTPEWIATGAALSAPVRAAVAPAVRFIVAELERHGIRPRARAVPRRPDVWWERTAARWRAVSAS